MTIPVVKISFVSMMKVVTPPFACGVLGRSEWQMDCCNNVVIIGSTIFYLLPSREKTHWQKTYRSYTNWNERCCVKIMFHFCGTFVMHWHIDCGCIILQDVHFNLSPTPGGHNSKHLTMRSLYLVELNQHISDTKWSISFTAVSVAGHLFSIA